MYLNEKDLENESVSFVTHHILPAIYMLDFSASAQPHVTILVSYQEPKTLSICQIQCMHLELAKNKCLFCLHCL